MAQASELERLAERRRLLVAQSDALRRQLVENIAGLQRSAAWIDRGYELIRTGRAIWPILAALAGLLLARGRGGWFAKAGKLVTSWRMIKKLARLYRSFRAQTA